MGPEGMYSRKCRNSCHNGEREISMYNNKCSGLKCCMCHTRWGSCSLAMVEVSSKALVEESSKVEAVDCGSGAEPEGMYSRKCRNSCHNGEREISMYNNKCSGLKCCMCHTR